MLSLPSDIIHFSHRVILCTGCCILFFHLFYIYFGALFNSTVTTTNYQAFISVIRSFNYSFKTERILASRKATTTKKKNYIQSYSYGLCHSATDWHSVDRVKVTISKYMLLILLFRNLVESLLLLLVFFFSRCSFHRIPLFLSDHFIISFCLSFVWHCIVCNIYLIFLV